MAPLKLDAFERFTLNDFIAPMEGYKYGAVHVVCTECYARVDGNQETPLFGDDEYWYYWVPDAMASQLFVWMYSHLNKWHNKEGKLSGSAQQA